MKNDPVGFNSTCYNCKSRYNTQTSQKYHGAYLFLRPLDPALPQTFLLPYFKEKHAEDPIAASPQIILMSI